MTEKKTSREKIYLDTQRVWNLAGKVPRQRMLTAAGLNKNHDYARGFGYLPKYKRERLMAICLESFQINNAFRQKAKSADIIKMEKRA